MSTHAFACPHVARARLAAPASRALWFAMLAVAGQLSAAQSPAPANRADWLGTARFGVMTHYLADWQARAHDLDMNVDQWNKMVDAFDAAGLAEQLKSLGAGYLIFTIGQNSGYYAAPNAAYDDIVRRTPSRCARRDLVADLARELAARQIKLIVYLPAGAPAGDRMARQALEWREGAARDREFQQHWESIIAEWSKRSGGAVAGWWFDGCYWPNAMYRDVEPPNFATFAAAARAGNPGSIVAFNPGVLDRVLSVTPHEDYLAGEINDIETSLMRRIEDGRVDGARVHKLSYLGAEWGRGEPRYKNLDDIVIPWTKRVIASGGAVTWDVPVEQTGLIKAPFVEQLRTLGEAL